jgi:hypothetical protein
MMTIKKYHYVYKTINTIDGRYYIGAHSTDDIDDSYFGSSKELLSDIKKYGKEAFKKEILQFVEFEHEKWIAEAAHVTLEVAHDLNSYNKAPGGRNWISAMTRERDPNLQPHQSKAGRAGAAAYHGSMTKEQKKEWHQKGARKAFESAYKNKRGLFSAAAKEKIRLAVIAAIKGTIELWHPDAPETCKNRKSPEYISGWSVRVKITSQKYEEYISLGYIDRKNRKIIPLNLSQSV